MTITGELKNLEKVQRRCIRFCKYLEKHHEGRYNDLMRKLACVIGTIEDALNFDEDSDNPMNGELAKLKLSGPRG